MFLRYLKSQQKEMIGVFTVIGALASVLQFFLFKKGILFSLFSGFLGIGLLLLAFLVLTYSNILRGMKKRKCYYIVTRTGKFAGVSKLFYCNLFDNQLRSVDSLSPFKFDMNRAMAAGLEKKGYYYIREGNTNYFVFSIKA